MKQPIELFHKPTESKSSGWFGMPIPVGNIAGVREVVEWVKSKDGFTVPYLTAEGFLVRWPESISGGRARHHWYSAGSFIAWLDDVEFDWEWTGELDRYVDSDGNPVDS